MPDQGVREIQLNGKQLVFMFMTATVAAVVIFLCGVMVGRGVNTTRVSAAAAAVAAEPTVDPTSTPEAPSTTSSDATSSTAPVSAQEDLKELTYAKRLEAPEPPPEPAIESVPVPAPAIAETKVERPAPAPAAASKAAASTAKPPAATTKVPAATTKEATTGEPKGTGFVVQGDDLAPDGELGAVLAAVDHVADENLLLFQVAAQPPRDVGRGARPLQ